VTSRDTRTHAQYTRKKENWSAAGRYKAWDLHGGDYEECRLLGYKNPVPPSQETHYVSTTESSQLMLCKVWGSYGGDYEECRLLGCYAVVARVRTDVSAELTVSIIRVTRIGELRATLAVPPKRQFLTRAIRCNFPEDAIVHSHRRENIKSRNAVTSLSSRGQSFHHTASTFVGARSTVIWAYT
jgi:hypothetical protein